MIKNYILLFFFFAFQSVSSQEALNVFDVARKGTVEQAKALHQQDPHIFNTVNEAGYSPLILACYRGNNEVAQFLIENGSDVNGSSSMGTPLMAAVVKGNIPVVKMLLSKKAAIDLADANGITPLIYAVQFNNVALTKLLLDYKADKTKVDKSGKTAFEYATFSGNETLINLLK
ncbi:ankyrin repeat domain-containing protein [Flavobacterium soli]|uniref:ankyrin repeat domain-containing protein n=1 Tax=Flavobacterium soli TaxID=344881 RepID=UPI0004099590|nr:ankyrin repeat domain-containing protein [Flavobacterium soli]